MNCNEVRNRIAQSPASDLDAIGLDGHISECAGCRGYLQDMKHLSVGLQNLTIPWPASMKPPAPAVPVRRVRTYTLLAATLAMLLMGALAAMVYKGYFATEDSSGPGSRDALFYTFGKDGAKKVKSPQTGQLAPEQSTPSPSGQSRN